MDGSPALRGFFSPRETSCSDGYAPILDSAYPNKGKNPVKCPNSRLTKRGHVPCGGCIICRKYKGMEWTARILLEWMNTETTSWFITMTYDDDNVPRTVESDLTLKKKETTQWVQNYLKNEQAFRYYLVGEYGDETKRPHYHMAVFPDEEMDLERFRKVWRRGFVSAYPMDPIRAAYLAKYTTKKLTKADDPRLLPGQEPEFRTSSRAPALGHKAAEVIADSYRTKSGSKILAEKGDIERSIRLDGRVYPLDDFMKRKIRTHLGIPLTHEERLNHEGYYEWHQTTDHEPDLQVLRKEEHRHRQKKARKKTRTCSV